MQNPQSRIPVIDHIKAIGAKRAAWLVDIWGVMHNGVTPFAGAVAACTAFRNEGGVVLLLSNAPRPGPSVEQQLDRIGVPREAYDGILSSGDASKTLIQNLGPVPVFHLGPTRDLTIYDRFGGRRLESHEPPEVAQAIVCTGLFDDETETPDDYHALLSDFAARGVDMICANPDIKVERGGKLIYCAGALARLYQELGGTVHYAGKPYPPIYVMAKEVLSTYVGRGLESSEILAIGDGVHTDIEGASRAGIDAVFVASRVHVTGGVLGEAVLSELFDGGDFPPPIAAMSELVW